MKTTRAARRYIRARFLALCLGVIALTAIDLGVCGSLVGRIGQTRALKTNSLPTPELSMSDFTVAAAAVK
jgi:hypothetical protein